MPTETEVGGSLPLPTSRRSIKFTPERLQQIINLVERGKSREEIAGILDVTVGSLQVTCSRLGISLRRPKIDNGVLQQKRQPLCENASVIHRLRDHDGRAPLQPIEEQSQGNLQSEPAEPAVIARPQQERAITPDACSASFAIRMQYRGEERTTELPFAQDMIAQLALEAVLRNMSIGEFVAEIIMAVLKQDRLQTALREDRSDLILD
jgi:hypothetical protein